MTSGKDDGTPDRSDERREGYVPSGRRGWRKVGGDRRATEVQPVTPNWSEALRDQGKEGETAKGSVILARTGTTTSRG